jgi:hypothetical protein
VVGPGLHWWYAKLDRWFPKTTRYAVAKKVAVDQAVAAPVTTLLFYTCLGAMVSCLGTCCFCRGC